MSEWFPVLWQGDRQHLAALKELGCPRSVPWAFIEQWRAGCLSNHGQTPERLAERGGLAPEEILALDADTYEERRRMWGLEPSESVPKLLALLAKGAKGR